MKLSPRKLPHEIGRRWAVLRRVGHDANLDWTCVQSQIERGA